MQRLECLSPVQVPCLENRVGERERERGLNEGFEHGVAHSKDLPFIHNFEWGFH